MLKRARILLIEGEVGMYFPYKSRIRDDRRTRESYLEVDVLSRYPQELRSSFTTGETRQTQVPMWSQRVKPTHFISLPLPPKNALVGRVKKMHEAMCFAYPSFEKLLIPLPRLHVTLGVFSLPAETARLQLRDISACVEQACHEICTQPLQLNFRGLGTFNHKSVLFIRCTVEKHFITLDRLVCKIRREVGAGMRIDMKGNPFDTYVPHITVAKIRPRHKAEFGHEIPISWYAEFQHNDFGDVTFNKVDICNMHGEVGKDGYYNVEASTSITHSHS